jgi:large subunit ribosomal protein L4
MAEKQQKKPADAKAKAKKETKEAKAPKSAKAAKAPARAAKPAKKTAKKKAEPAAPVAPAAPQDLASWDVLNAQNEKVRQLALSPDVFGVRVNEHLLYEAVKQYRAGGRSGTHMTKNRALVAGSGKKPWRQKGTGRARIGSVRNPLWRHGGTVFGPQPRDYSYTMPKKARASALRSALSQRVKDGALKVVEAFSIETPKTKVLKGILNTLGVNGKTVLVDHEPTDALVLSGRNIPGLKVVDTSHLTVYDVLDCTTLLVSQEAVEKLEERLTP